MEARSCSILSVLPLDVLHHILKGLSRRDLIQLLQTSKGIAQEVLRHSPGKFTRKVRLQQGVSLEAVRKLLQWAPPGCLKLKAHDSRINEHAEGNWSGIRDQLDIPHIVQLTGGQQFPGILEVCLMGFTLPTLMPAELAAAFPNLQALRLCCCKIKDTPQLSHSTAGSNKWACGTSSTGRGVVIASAPAKHLHTLTLSHTWAPDCKELPSDSVRCTRSMQAAVQCIDQLRSSMPNVTCLKLPNIRPHADRKLLSCKSTTVSADARHTPSATSALVLMRNCLSLETFSPASCFCCQLCRSPLPLQAVDPWDQWGPPLQCVVITNSPSAPDGVWIMTVCHQNFETI